MSTETWIALAWLMTCLALLAWAWTRELIDRWHDACSLYPRGTRVVAEGKVYTVTKTRVQTIKLR